MLGDEEIMSSNNSNEFKFEVLFSGGLPLLLLILRLTLRDRLRKVLTIKQELKARISIFCRTEDNDHIELSLRKIVTASVHSFFFFFFGSNDSKD